MVATRDGCPSHTPGAYNDDTPVLTGMGADASCTRIGRADHSEEGVRIGSRSIRPVTEASQRKAGDDLPILVREAGVLQALLGCSENLREGLVEAKPNVCRTGNPLAKAVAAGIRQAGAAFRAAAIDSKEKHIRLHDTCPVGRLPG
jgi:hypothetical protein